MSMKDYVQAKEILKQSHGLLTFRGSISETTIEDAEKKLSVKFPESYRQFLLDYGAGGVGSFEIYGIPDERLNSIDNLSVISFTLKGRKEWGMPVFLLPIYELGEGELFCVDFRTQEKNRHEAKIVGFTPGYSSNNENLEIVASDFGELFLKLVQMEVSIPRD